LRNVPGVYSSVTFIFVGLGTEEYICVIFLDIKEFKKIEEYFLFCCSDNLLYLSTLYSSGFVWLTHKFKVISSSVSLIHSSILIEEYFMVSVVSHSHTPSYNKIKGVLTLSRKTFYCSHQNSDSFTPAQFPGASSRGRRSILSTPALAPRRQYARGTVKKIAATQTALARQRENPAQPAHGEKKALER
jgi:hypothetical protein